MSILKFTLPIVVAMCSPLLIKAQTPTKLEFPGTTPVSAPTVQMRTDSVFLDVASDGTRCLIHRVSAGQNLFSIAKFYRTTAIALRAKNNLTVDALKLGQTLMIPVSGKAIIRERKGPFQLKDYTPVYYRVKEKETLFRLAKVYFKMPLDSVKTRNRLKSDAVHQGQVLHIGWINKTGIPDGLAPTIAQTPAQKASQGYEASYITAKTDKKEVSEEGAAYWRRDDRLTSETSLFVLHNTAKKGSIIEIINPQNKVKIYAKVIGKIPKNDHTANCIVVISPALARAIDAKDSKVFLKLKYLK